jgi:hypothetical protein
MSVGAAIESSSLCTASMVPACMARNSSPVGTSWSAKYSSISISPLAALLKASIEGLMTCSASAGPA